MAKARTIVGNFTPRRIKENIAVLLYAFRLELMWSSTGSTKELAGRSRPPDIFVTLAETGRCTSLP
jgi:hypothetical protein